MKKSNHFLFHAVLQKLKDFCIRDKHLLVGVSGGLDSMTLLAVLLSLSRILKLKISVVYVHHGSAHKKQKAFQNRALKTVQNLCRQNNLVFYSNAVKVPPPVSPTGGTRSVTSFTKLPSSPVSPTGGTRLNGGNRPDDRTCPAGNTCPSPYGPKNEAQMRTFRYQVFLKYFKKSQADFLVLAHTAEDLLETQILRLIRGTGAQGIKAMRLKRGPLLRPFIELSRTQIKNYAQHVNLKWCEDPSNQSTEYSLRNWLRQEWLPCLEKKRPGSLKAMARSLNLLAYCVHKNQIQIKQTAKALITEGTLRRDRLLTFPVSTRQKIVAYYLKEQGIKNYSSNHIKELLKNLERKQKNFQFFLLQKTWKVSAHRLMCN